MATKKRKLAPVDDARQKYNQASRQTRGLILERMAKDINYKDSGQVGYWYGNLYPKTRTAIRRYFA